MFSGSGVTILSGAIGGKVTLAGKLDLRGVSTSPVGGRGSTLCGSGVLLKTSEVGVLLGVSMPSSNKSFSKVEVGGIEIIGQLFRLLKVSSRMRVSSSVSRL